MNWPDSLVAELASRRCVIFMGAGASAGCVSAATNNNPPRWGEFLEGLKAITTAAGDLPVINDLIAKEKYLDAAEVMFASIPPADFTKFIRDTFQIPNFQPSEIHKAILQIDPKVVVTTNYDEI